MAELTAQSTGKLLKYWNPSVLKMHTLKYFSMDCSFSACETALLRVVW